MKPVRHSVADALRQLALKPNDPQNLLAASSAATKRGIAYAFAPIIEAASYAWPSDRDLAFYHADILAMHKNTVGAATVLRSIVTKIKSGEYSLEGTWPWLLNSIVVMATKIKRVDIADDLIDFAMSGSRWRVTMTLRLALVRALVLTDRSTEAAAILREILDYVRRLHLEPGAIVSAEDISLGRALLSFKLSELVGMLGSHLVMQWRYAEATQFAVKMSRNLSILNGKNLPALQSDCGAIHRFSATLQNANTKFGQLRRRPRALITLPIWGEAYFDFFRQNISSFWQKAVSKFPGIIAIQVVTRHADAERASELLTNFANIDNVETMCTTHDEPIQSTNDMYTAMTASHNLGFCLAKENDMIFFPLASDSVVNDDFFAKADHILSSGYDAIMMVGLFWRADKLEQLKDQMSQYVSTGSFDISARDMYASISNRALTYETIVSDKPGDRSLYPVDPSLFLVRLLDRVLVFGVQRQAMGLSPKALRKLHFLPRSSYDDDLTDRVLLAVGAERIWMNADCKDLTWFMLEKSEHRGSAGSAAWRGTPPPRQGWDFDLEALRAFNRYRNLASPGRLLSLRKPLVIHFSRERSDDREEERYRKRFERIADLLEASYISRADLLLRDDLIGELAVGLFPRES